MMSSSSIFVLAGSFVNLLDFLLSILEIFFPDVPCGFLALISSYSGFSFPLIFEDLSTTGDNFFLTSLKSGFIRKILL